MGKCFASGSAGGGYGSTVRSFWYRRPPLSNRSGLLRAVGSHFWFWRLTPPDQPMPPPARGGEPGARLPGRWRAICRRQRRPEAIEPRGRGARVDGPPVLGVMLLEIHQHVDDRMASLPGGLERPGVIAVAPHPSPAPQGAVDGPRRADGQATGPAGEGTLVLGFQEEMEVVTLHREMHHAELDPARQPDGFADGLEQA